VDPAGNPTYDKAPIEYYDHYTFIPNPDGFYGLGLGFLLGHLNTAINKILRQTVDAATLSNVGNQSGFMASSIGADRGDVQMQLGKLMRTNVSGDELQKGIYTFKFPGPNQALVSVMDMLQRAGRGLASSPEALTGNTDKVLQPTTFMGIVEQAQVFFSTVYERIFGVWQNELLKHYKLNGKYLDEEEYFAVNDLSGSPEEMMVSREDYRPDLMVIPLADPKMATEQQRLAKSEAEYQTLVQNPMVVNDPMALYQVTRRRLEALGATDIDQVLPMPQQKEPQREDDPLLENIGSLLPAPMMPEVFADQNHLAHLRAHEGLLNDPAYGQRMTPEGQKMIQAHIQKHIALLYAVTETPFARQLDGQVGQDGMDEAAGNAGVSGPTPFPVQSAA
jgi:hypothetical protein